MNYSFDIKRKAAKMYLEEGVGSITITKELNLSSNIGIYNRSLIKVNNYSFYKIH